MYMGTSVVRRGPLYYKMLEKERVLKLEERRRDEMIQEASRRHQEMVRARMEQEERAAKLRRDYENFRMKAPVLAIPTVPSINIPFEEAARHLRVPFDEVMSRKRFNHIVYARHIGTYVAYNLFNRSMPTIGLHLKRDHSTVVNSIHNIANLINRGDQKTMADVRAVTDAVIARTGRESRYWGA